MPSTLSVSFSALRSSGISGLAFTTGLLSASEGMDIHGEHADRRLVEAPGPGRHHAVARIGHGLPHGRAVAAIQPDLVGQVRRTEFAVAAAILAMAGSALFGEDLGTLLVGGRLARQRK